MDSNNVAKFAAKISDEYELEYQNAERGGFVPTASNCENCVYGNEKCGHSEYHNIKNQPLENETLKVVKLCGFWGHGFNKNGYCPKHQSSNSLNNCLSMKYPDMRQETSWLLIK